MEILLAFSGLLLGWRIAASTTQPRFFRAPIKRRQGHSPVIDVTFNHRQTFEMLVDTGASITTMTQAMAEVLHVVQPTGTETFRVTSGELVELLMGQVSAIAVNGRMMKNLMVAIVVSDEEMGLLGQDFLNQYQITLKKTVIEFQVR
ncbi:retropepsin-like aspartic protease family protein [Trichothermofontia sp.]